MKIREATAPRRAITRDEVETYSRDGVVCLRGVLSRDSIKSIEDAIETATASLDQSYGGYNLTAIVDAIASDDQETLKAQSGKQYSRRLARRSGLRASRCSARAPARLRSARAASCSIQALPPRT